MTRPVDGLVVVDKAGGMTSHDVVSRVRRLAGTRKVGHAGTLDPMATGVLVLGVNRATRLLGHLTLTDKAYDATVRLGAATTTDDAEGEVVTTASTDDMTEAAIREGLAGFVGEIEQVPSSVSAIKVDGRRAYERVRAGELVALESRRCGSTSSRSATSAAPTSTCRSGAPAAPTSAPSPATWGSGSASADTWSRCAVPPSGPTPSTPRAPWSSSRTSSSCCPSATRPASRSPSLDLDEAQAEDVRFGRKLSLTLGHDGPVALFAPDGAFLALYEQDGDLARAVAVFV